MVEEEDLEAEKEVIWLLTVTGERQVENYHSWIIKLLGGAREIPIWSISA